MRLRSLQRVGIPADNGEKSMIIWADQKATELDFALSKMTHRVHELLVDLEKSRAADAD